MARKRLGAEATGVSIEGLPELQKALRALDNGLEKELAKANREVATFVASEAKGAASGLGGVAAKAAPSVGASSSSGFAGVGLGGGAYPFAGGAEFGGRRRPTTMQFQPWRGAGANAGYFLYPTIRRNAQRIEETYTENVDDLIRRAGLDG